MTYALSAPLQAAVYQALLADAGVSGLVGADIYDALPTGSVPALYVLLGDEKVKDASDGSGQGAWHDFAISVVPMLRQDAGLDVPLWAWFAQISESRPSFGGYSGAPPTEKISWGKLGVDTPQFVIESDASIVLPLILSSLE